MCRPVPAPSVHRRAILCHPVIIVHASHSPAWEGAGRVRGKLGCIFEPRERPVTESPAPGRRPLVVLPTYNELDNIVAIVGAIRENLPSATVWIVDDNSPDGTGQIADELAAADSHVEVLHRPGKLGLGTAYIEAFGRALQEGFDAVLQMDA